jgi:hypothetical protein
MSSAQRLVSFLGIEARPAHGRRTLGKLAWQVPAFGEFLDFVKRQVAEATVPLQHLRLGFFICRWHILQIEGWCVDIVIIQLVRVSDKSLIVPCQAMLNLEKFARHDTRAQFGHNRFD